MFKKILVPIEPEHDNSWRETLPLAVNHVRQSSGEIILLTVLPEIEANLRRTTDSHQKVLDQFVRDNVPEDVTAQTVIRRGSIHREICNTAKQQGADLIVMASQNPRMKDRILGSNASNVVRYAPCTVTVVRAK